MVWIVLLIVCLLDVHIEWTMFKHKFVFKINSMVTQVTKKTDNIWISLHWDDVKKSD